MSTQSGRWRWTGPIGAGLCVSVSLMAWFGLQAAREWQHSAASLAQQRTNDAADLFTSALLRDLQGAENSVLLSWRLNAGALDDPSSDTEALVASAFAQYPYPESFFAWHGEPTQSSLIFFNR